MRRQTLHSWHENPCQRHSTNGVSSEEILQDFPDLELQDIQACLFYAARRVDFERLAA